MRFPAMGRVPGPHQHIDHARSVEIAAGQFGQTRVDLDGIDELGLGGQHRGHKTAAGANFQHGIGVPDRQFLQHPRFETRRKHGLPGLPISTERNFHVGKGKITKGDRNEILTPHHREQFEHDRIQHARRADLLLDHVETGSFGQQLRLSHGIPRQNIHPLLAKQRPMAQQHSIIPLRDTTPRKARAGKILSAA